MTLLISTSNSQLRAEMADPTKFKMRTSLRLGGLLGFIGGFLMAYQRSSGLCKFFRPLVLLSYVIISTVLGLVGEST